MSPLLYESDILVLENQIERFLSLSSKLFGSDLIAKYKFHALIHYPSQIREYGPTARHTVRNETSRKR